MKAFVLLALLSQPASDGERRAIWVTRWDYRTADDVRAIVANCASLGCTDILWQARGQADAYYPSKLEPWGGLIGGKDPGFDPLALAVKESRARGLRLHAWINVMPLWRGKEPPGDRASVYAQHPDWVVVGRDGKPQPLNDSYLCANPARDEWVAHVCAVAADIAGRYEIDGLHLDYIRYLEGDWSYDDATMRRFREAHGGAPADKPAEWTEFRRALVTDVVRRLRDVVRGARPSAALTSAVYPSRKARANIHQDAERWVRDGLVASVFPMQYRDKDGEFEALVREARESFGEKAYPGVGVFKHATADQTARQIGLVRSAGAKGVGLFCYANFWSTYDESYRRAPQSLRDERIRAVRDLLKR